MRGHRKEIVSQALRLLEATGSDRLFLFLQSARDWRWFLGAGLPDDKVTLVISKTMNLPDALTGGRRASVIRSWAGNQTRFSRVKYAFLHGVLSGIIDIDSKIICVLGPWGTSHLDTITIHDLNLSWTEDFPLDPRAMVLKKGFTTVMAMIDIALDIGAMGREGKSVGTTFVIGDSDNVLKTSHQAVFNPFRGYPKRERRITLPEVVESVKELASLDGAIIVSEQGVVEAAGRHLDASGPVTKQLRGLGARHRAGAGISRKTDAVAVVVSESTGRVTIFEHGRIVASLEPVISRRLV